MAPRYSSILSYFCVVVIGMPFFAIAQLRTMVLGVVDLWCRWQQAKRVLVKRPARRHAPGKPTHASVMATLNRHCWIAMLQGDDEAASQYLEKALLICQLNEPHRGNAGESARVQWRMSQVLERRGMVEEAKQLRATAERVKRELLETGDYAIIPDDEEARWDALVGLLYR